MVVSTEDRYNPDARIGIQTFDQRRKKVHGKFQKKRRPWLSEDTMFGITSV